MPVINIKIQMPLKLQKKMFDECNVVYREYKSKGKNIIITVLYRKRGVIYDDCARIRR